MALGKMIPLYKKFQADGSSRVAAPLGGGGARILGSREGPGLVGLGAAKEPDEADGEQEERLGRTVANGDDGGGRTFGEGRGGEEILDAPLAGKKTGCGEGGDYGREGSVRGGGVFGNPPRIEGSEAFTLCLEDSDRSPGRRKVCPRN